jgi:hypothetical protein
LRPPKPVLLPGFWEEHGLFIAIVAAVVVLLGVVVWRILARPRPPVVPSPAEEARAALDPLHGRATDAALLAKVSTSLRRYFVQALDLARTELTNSELCEMLAHHPRVPPELRNSVTELLLGMEHRRFGDRPPARVPTERETAIEGPEDLDAEPGLVDKALRLIDETEQVLQTVDAESAIPTAGTRA